MSRSFSARRRSVSEAQTVTSQSDVSLSPDSADRLRRLAALVAVGEAPFPADLEPGELSIVYTEVARLRRDRLVHLIARSIAEDLHGEGGR